MTHGSNWIKLKQLLQQDIFLKSIESVQQTNQKNNLHAIWLVGATSKSLYSRYGLRYTIQTNGYSKLIEILTDAPCTIGLHSINNESIVAQAQRLMSFTNTSVHYHRSHFLKQSQNLGEELSQANIKVDFSYGHARQTELLNTPQQGPINYIPTILFDNAFFFNKPKEVISGFATTLKRAQLQNRDVAICFHPENFLVMPALHEYYEEVIRLAKNEGAAFARPITAL